MSPLSPEPEHCPSDGLSVAPEPGQEVSAEGATNAHGPMEPASAGELQRLIDRVGEYLDNALADNTRRAYASDWADFAAWCTARGRAALPASPETLALYLAALGERAKLSTVTRRMSAIRCQHREANLDCAAAHAGVSDLLAGIRRTKRVAPQRKKALLVEELRGLVENLPANLLGL